MTDFIDEEVYGVEFSAGGINAYYLSGCDTVGHRPGYAICLHKNMAFKRDGKLNDLVGCEAPIRNGTCPAQRMRAEELAKGRAIYFINRVKMLAAKATPQVKTEVKKPTKPAAMIYPAYVVAQIEANRGSAAATSGAELDKSPVTKEFDDTGYAAVIKTGLAAAPEVSCGKIEEKPVSKEASVVPKPGESLLELARRMMNKQP